MVALLIWHRNFDPMVSDIVLRSVTDELSLVDEALFKQTPGFRMRSQFLIQLIQWLEYFYCSFTNISHYPTRNLFPDKVRISDLKSTLFGTQPLRLKLSSGITCVPGRSWMSLVSYITNLIPLHTGKSIRSKCSSSNRRFWSEVTWDDLYLKFHLNVRSSASRISLSCCIFCVHWLIS